MGLSFLYNLLILNNQKTLEKKIKNFQNFSLSI